MSIGLSFWLAKRSKDRFVRSNARRDIRHRMRQQWLDYGKRGKGSKAWNRVKAMLRDPNYLVWPDYAL